MLVAGLSLILKAPEPGKLVVYISGQGERLEKKPGGSWCKSESPKSREPGALMSQDRKGTVRRKLLFCSV
jgi:hypothetical protein